jgi:choline monooxygenase
MDTLTIERLRKAVDEEFSRNAPPEGFPNLPRIPSRRYTSPDFHALEMEAVFDKSWLIAGTLYDFPEVGSFKVFDNMGRAEVLLVRAEDGEVRAFYNTCKHRGATVIRDREGTVNNLMCQFHSWTYDLEGKLIAVPDERDFSNDPTIKDCNLSPIRCEVWAGFVFINLDKDAPDLESWLGPVAEDFAWVEGLRPSHRRERLLACSWRVAIEAFIEVYHIGTVHPNSVATTLNHRGTVSNFYPNGHSRMIVPNPNWYDADKDIDQGGEDTDEAFGFRGECNVSYNIFPNVLVPSGQTGFTLMEFWPVDEGHCRLVTWCVQPDDHDAESRKMAQDYFDNVLDEDTWNMEHIQLSLKSPEFEGLKIGVHEKRIYYLEQSLDQMIGQENIPADLQVPPVLEKYIVHTAQDV